MTTPRLDADHLHRALTLRDLSDPAQGEHAVNVLLNAVVDGLCDRWGIPRTVVRHSPLVSIRNNYDRLGYGAGEITRDARYTRYTSPTTMLRSHTSADIPAALETYSDAATDVDELIVVPGLVYRRDVVDRTHVGEPHQVDLWRLRSTPATTDTDLTDMIATLVQGVLPGAQWRTTPATHPYTLHGRQIDVRHEGQWLELAECGLIHPGVLRRSGLDPARWSGLALGMGLERAVMVRKGIPDIRYLRSTDPRVAEQLRNLDPWSPVSMLPPISRDLSIVIDSDLPDEILGDRVRNALADRVHDIEAVQVLARTAWADLHPHARERLGLAASQSNALVRLVLRPLERTLTGPEANDIRNRVYRALHQGPHQELA